MADITMCNGRACPLKENCYRYKATPSDFWQAYFTLEPYDHEKKECDYEWKIKVEKS